MASASVLAACGGGDDSDASGTNAKTAGLATACTANIELTKAFNSLTGNETPAQAKAAFAKAGFSGILDRLEKNAPAAIAAKVDEGVAALRKVGSTGDFSGLDAFDAGPIDAYFYEHCDYEQVEVKATEYKFAGLPDELPAGDTGFKFVNDGKESHEMLFAKRKPGTTESLKQLLALPDQEVSAKVDIVAGTGADPGDTVYLATTLPAGKYIAVCFVAQGTTAGKDGKGPPHAMLGMTAEFTVS